MEARVIFTSTLYGVRFWEVEVRLGARLHRVEVTLREMKRKGVTKNHNGFKKVEAWLNSAEGKAYLAEKLVAK